MNSFAGTLDLAGVEDLKLLAFDNTNIEGKLPAHLTQPLKLRMLRVGDTLVEGSLPSGLAEIQKDLAFVSLRNLHLEGSLPASLRRMAEPNTSLVLGQGLAGVMPMIAGTLLMLSIYQNSFEGHPPELRLTPWSIVVAHSNRLSCQLPSCGQVTPALVLALLGNRFQRPHGEYPPWTHGFERGDFFVASNRDASWLMLQTMGGIWTLTTVAAVKTYDAAWVQAREMGSARSHWKYGHVQSVFRDSFLMAWQFACCACLCNLVYFYGVTHSCMTIMGRLRVPLMSSQASMCTLVEAMLAVLICSKRPWQRYSVKRLWTFSDGGLISSSACVQRLSFWKRAVQRHRMIGKILTWGRWWAICCCISAPGALYSMLKAIPGFLQVSRWLMVILTQSISLCTSFLTLAWLPILAATFHKDIRQEELVSMGNLLTVPLLPAFVAFVFTEQCLGQWARIWQPCVENPSPLDVLEHVRLPFFQQSFASAISSQDKLYNEGLLGRRELCSRGHMSPRRCADAVLERSGTLLLSTAAHYAFVGPLWRALTSRRMALGSAYVHLTRVWNLMLMFGASVPLLCAFSAANLFVHIWLLFGGAGKLLRCDGSRLDEDTKAQLPWLSMTVALMSGFVWQLCLLYVSHSALLG